MSTFSLPRFVCLAVSFAVALLLVACSKPVETTAPPKPVRVQPAVLAPASQQESYTGAVRARVESEVAFRVGGKVFKRHVEVGQRVRAGDVIAELDAMDYALGVQAAVDQQRAAAVDAEQAASDARRFASLLSDGAISQGDTERQRARADAARERLAQAGRQVELARNRASYAVLRAPFDGVVTALRAEPGQVVGEGHPVATLAALGEREIVIDIPESRVLQTKSTATATASLWAGEGGRFGVTLRELSPAAATATRTYRARYRVGPDAPQLELGMTATVWLGTEAAAAPMVATLPASALHHDQGQPAVWVVVAGSGTPTLIPVRVTRYGQDEMQITGLQNGQWVVTAGVQKLNPGMSVVAVDADGKPLSASAAASAGRAWAAIPSPARAR